MNNIEVVRAQKDRDLLFIINSQIQMALETENYVLQYDNISKGAEAVFKDQNKGVYWVALLDGIPIASLLQTYEWSDWRARTVWWIQSVYVLPQYRGHGVFQQMYRTLKEIVENDDSLAGLRLYVDKSNEKALAIYHKLGMNSSHYNLCEWLKF